LFHRLNVIRLRLPPLRERSDDVPALAKFFLQKSAKELGVEPKRISDDALTQLKGFEFPGNVRQLENLCHWLTVMAPAQLIEGKDLPVELIARAPGSEATTERVTTPAVAPVAEAARTVDPVDAANVSAATAVAPAEARWLNDLE